MTPSTVPGSIDGSLAMRRSGRGCGKRRSSLSGTPCGQDGDSLVHQKSRSVERRAVHALRDEPASILKLRNCVDGQTHPARPEEGKRNLRSIRSRLRLLDLLKFPSPTTKDSLLTPFSFCAFRHPRVSILESPFAPSALSRKCACLKTILRRLTFSSSTAENSSTLPFRLILTARHITTSISTQNGYPPCLTVTPSYWVSCERNVGDPPAPSQWLRSLHYRRRTCTPTCRQQKNQRVACMGSPFDISISSSLPIFSSSGLVLFVFRISCTLSLLFPTRPSSSA